MPLFKAYLKVLKKNISTIIVYFAVFIGMTIILGYSGSPFIKEISTAKINVVVFDNDNSELSNDFIDYLDDYFIIKDMTAKRASDALFYRDIYSIINITDFMSPDSIHIIGLDGTSSQIFIDLVISKYISLARFHLSSGLSEDQIIMKMKESREDIKNSICIETIVSDRIEYESTLVFVNFSAYILMGGLLSLITIVMRSFKEFEIKRRLDISNYSMTKIHGSLLLSNLLYSVTFLVLILLIGYVVSPNNQFNWFFVLNMFVFTLLSLSLAYLISMFFKSHKVLGSVSQVIALAPAFITGVFISQSLIDPNVLNFSKIFPYYWYVSANNAVINNDLSHYFSYIGVLFIYIIIFISASILVSLRQRRSENG